MQRACAILSSWACPALQYFSTLSHKRNDFRKEVIEYKLCILIFSTTFVWNRSHSRRTERDMIKMNIGLQVKYPLFLSGFKELEFLKRFSKYTQYQISRKSVRWEPSCSMRTDGWTNIAKLIAASRNFAKAPNNRMVHEEECRRTSSRPIAGAVPELSGQTLSVRKLNLGIRITKQKYEPLDSHVRSSKAVGHITCSSVWLLRGSGIHINITHYERQPRFDARQSEKCLLSVPLTRWRWSNPNFLPHKYRQLKHEADHSILCRYAMKNEWSYASSSHIFQRARFNTVQRKILFQCETKT